jgi:hypothetical protein
MEGEKRRKDVGKQEKRKAADEKWKRKQRAKKASEKYSNSLRGREARKQCHRSSGPAAATVTALPLLPAEGICIAKQRRQFSSFSIMILAGLHSVKSLSIHVPLSLFKPRFSSNLDTGPFTCRTLKLSLTV